MRLRFFSWARLRTTLAALLFQVVYSTCVDAGEVRVSFLRDDSTLADTLLLLKKSGCRTSSVTAFKGAVQSYNASDFKFDISKFPLPRAGVYSFASPQLLVDALTHCPCETQHEYDLNCFDATILLMTPKLKTKHKADELQGLYMFTMWTTNNTFMPAVAATARDMFTQKYPAEYLSHVQVIMTNCPADLRIGLTAALFSDYVLPLSTTEQTVKAAVFATLQSEWSRHGVQFPDNCEVVLCHEASLPRRYFGTTHTGVLMHHGKGFVYLEKAGGTGPFVRLDLKTREDLLPWLAAMFIDTNDGQTHLFATFNNKQIVELPVIKRR